MKISLNRSGVSPAAGDVRPQMDDLQLRRRTRLYRGALVAILAVALVGAPTVGFAAESSDHVSRESGLGAAAAISSLVYGPVKILWAVGGLVSGGLAWAFTAGDTEVASTVFTRSLRGTYVITPAILTGEEPLEFIGRDIDDSQRTENVAAVDAAPTTTTQGFDDSGYDEMGW
jgi:hypothetical protein